jgi:hypothetical protein
MPKKRAFKTKTFTKWMKKTDLKDQDLLFAITEMEAGLIDADLGGNVLKKRIALPGMGKRSSSRVLVASKFLSRWFFLFGFTKNEKSNVSDDELIYLQETAKRLFHLSDLEIQASIFAGELKELINNDK